MNMQSWILLLAVYSSDIERCGMWELCSGEEEGTRDVSKLLPTNIGIYHWGWGILF